MNILSSQLRIVLKPRLIALVLLVLSASAILNTSSPAYGFYQNSPPTIFSITWSPDGSMIAVGRGSISCSGSDNDVHILNAATGNIISTLTGHLCEVMSVSWRSDGKRLATTSTDGHIRIWDTNTWELLFSSEELVGRKISVWSPDGNMLASLRSGYSGVELLDASTGQHQSYLCCDSGVPISVVWSPDSSKLAFTSTDKNIYVWNVLAGQPLLTLAGHSDYATAVDWSPDGSKLASGGGRTDPTIRIWNSTIGDALRTLQGHTDFVTEVVWSPDGSQLASSSNDGTVRVWDATTGQQLNLIQSSDRIHAVAWSPDGSQLAYGDNNGILYINPAPLASQSTPTPPTVP